jgi:hypothetical protein
MNKVQKPISLIFCLFSLVIRGSREAQKRKADCSKNWVSVLFVSLLGCCDAYLPCYHFVGIHVFIMGFPFQYKTNNYSIRTLLITANDYCLHLRQYAFSFPCSHLFPVFMQSPCKSNLLSYCDGIMIDMYSVNITIISVRYPKAIHDFLLPLGEYQIIIFKELMITPYPNRLDQ